MPHVIVKMFPGRPDALKQELADKIAGVLMETINVEEKSISVSFEEIPKVNWAKEVYKTDIVDKEKTLFKKPGYFIPERKYTDEG